MLYLGSFSGYSESESITFEVIFDAETLMEAEKKFRDYLRTTKDEILDGIEEIYCDDIYEIESVSASPTIIKYVSIPCDSDDGSGITSLISRSIGRKGRGTRITVHYYKEDTNGVVPVFVTRKVSVDPLRSKLKVISR